MSPTDTAICAVITLAIAGLAGFARALHGSWLAPGAILAGTWALTCALPLLLAPEYPAFPGAYGLVLGLVVAGLLGSVLAPAAPTYAPAAWPMRRLRLAFAVLVVLAAAGSIANLVRIHVFAGGNALASVALDVSEAMYTGDLSDSGATRLLLLPSYAAALMGGVVAGRWRFGLGRGMWWPSLLWLGPMAADALVSTRRAGLLIATVLWLAGHLAAMVASPRAERLRIAPLLLAATIAAPVIVGLFVVLQSLRMGFALGDDVGFLLDHLMPYFTGHMAAFGSWLANERDPAQALELGSRTFAGMATALGLGNREAGIYQDVVELPTGQSNIYTALRPLIEDYGTIGAAGFVAALGFVGGWGFNLLRRGHVRGAVWFAPFVAYVLWSPIISLFTYNTTTVAFVVLAALVAVPPRAPR